MRNNTKLDWQILLDDAEWKRPESLAQLARTEQNPSPPPRHPYRQIPRWLASLAVAVVLALSAAGFLLWRQAQAGYQQIQADFTEVVELEAWTIQTGDRAAHATLTDANTSAAWRKQLRLTGEAQPWMSPGEQITILDVDRQDDVAMVALSATVTATNPPFTYRTTRFYRAVDGAWLRTEPVDAFWGPRQTLETAHFIFHFGQKDRGAVETAAPRIEAIYAGLRRDLSLTHARDGKIVVDLVSMLPPYQYRQPGMNRVAVLSPRLQRIPDHLADADILTQSIVYPLVDLTMAGMRDRNQIGDQWSLLLHGIKLWQVYDSSDWLLPYERDVITWLYRDAPAIGAGERVPSVDDLALLCRGDFLVSHTSATALSPFLLCTIPEGHEYIHTVLPPPRQLGALAFDADGSGQHQWIRRQRVAAATVVEYLVAAYGRERLPVLIANLRQHTTWRDLIPAVVGASAEEFEAGWQDYVATHYGACATECSP